MMAESDKCELDIVDRGWNDPPQTAFTSFVSTKSKTKLNQRVAFPNETLLPPNETDRKQTLNPDVPPVGSSKNCIKKIEDKPDYKSIEPTDINVVESRFRSVLTQHESKLNKKTFDDINKRLKIMEQTWQDGKLNDVIQQRIMELSKALVNENFEEANRIHLSLAVDYAGIVSPWLVGVKHLIQQAKNTESGDAAS